MTGRESDTWDVRCYLDASAAAKLLVDEPESDAVARHLDHVAEGGELVSSALLETELRLAVRERLSQQAVSLLLERIDVIEPSRSLSIKRVCCLVPGCELWTRCTAGRIHGGSTCRPR